MKKTMFRVKTILFIIYDLLCLYTATICAYVSVRPVCRLLCRTKFADKMLEMNDWYPIAYIMAVIIGGGCCIFLCIEYCKQPKIFAPFLVSLLMHPIVIFTMPYSAPILNDVFNSNLFVEHGLKYLYWFFVACAIATIVYSIVILIKEKKLLKYRKAIL